MVFGYLPDLERDIVQPLRDAGYGPGVIAALGEGFDDRRVPHDLNAT